MKCYNDFNYGVTRPVKPLNLRSNFMKRVLTILVAVAMFAALAIGSGAAMKSSWLEGGAADGDGFTILTDGTDGVSNDLTTAMLTSATRLVIVCSPDDDEMEIELIWGAHLGGWWNDWKGYIDEVYADGKITFVLADVLKNYDEFLSNGGHVLDDGEPGALKLMFRAWGAYDSLNVTDFYLEGMATAAPVETPIGDTSAPVTAPKDGADTGIGSVAVASAVALVAAGAVVFARKRK